MRRTAAECRNEQELRELQIARRDEKRRKRAKLYARGLTCYGKPVDFVNGNGNHKAHPPGCKCADHAWWNKPTEYAPVVYRVCV